MLAVEIKDVRKSYKATLALKGVDLGLRPGITCLLGRNGAGKSTLARIVVGIEEPTAGEVVVSRDGTALSGRDRLSHIGWLPQSFGYPPRMSVRDFVTYAGWLKGVSKNEARELVDDALEIADLYELANKRLGELSGGMLRRTGLAASIVHRPGLLVLDEPTAGLDPVQRDEFHRRIRQIGKNTSVLLATHLLEDVEALATTISVIDHGAIIWAGRTEALAAESGASSVSVDALRAGLLRLIGTEPS